MSYKVTVEKIAENSCRLLGPMETAYLRSIKEVERKLRTYQVTPDEFYVIASELLNKGVIVLEQSNSKLVQVS